MNRPNRPNRPRQALHEPPAVRTRIVPGTEPVAYPELWTAPPKGSVLVLAPHQDDETFGCGGAILLHRAQSDSVAVQFVTNGDKGDPDGHYPKEGYVALREREAREAAAVLGVTDVAFMGLPDGHGAARPDLQAGLERSVADLVAARRPSTVYYPWIGEAHPDHFALARAVESVASRTEGILFLGYELWSACVPTAILDVSSVVPKKLEAARVYASQLRYTDYVPIGIGLMTYRSLYLQHRGGKHGEAFVRFVPAALPMPPPSRRSFLSSLFGGRD